jgi:succinate-acetate transporter protein
MSSIRTSAHPTTDTPTAAEADPGPLGLAGFAATTLVLSFVNAGLVGAGVAEAVLPLALFYGGLGQLIAGLFEFRKGNTFGATAFCTYGGFWLAFAFYEWFFAAKAGPDANTALGMFLLVFTIVTAYLAVASLRTTGALVAVFVLLALTFLFLTIGAFSASEGMSKLGGWLGIVTAVVAFYASFATVTNETWKRTVLPVFPMAPRA